MRSISNPTQFLQAPISIKIKDDSLKEQDDEMKDVEEKDNDDEEFDDEVIANFIKKNDNELAQALEKVLEALLTSLSSKSTFHIQLLVKSNDQDQDQE